MPLVMNQVAAMASARPSQPTCSSHSLRRQTSAAGVPRGTERPGTKTRLMMGITTMGTPVQRVMSSQGGTVSCSVKGKLW